MLQKVNEVYETLFTQHPRYFILMGGRGAGRSTVASQFANARLIAPEYFRCAIMRYVWSDIRESIYKEITDRLDENELADKTKINDSTMLIEYALNSIKAVGFRKSSEARKAKLKSLASYNYVIIEEGDEIPEEDFMQLDDSLRTLKGNITIIILLNPPAKDHWILKRWFDLIPSGIKDFYIPKLKEHLTDTMAIITDYHCNEINIAPASLVQYEAYKGSKPNHYYNMIKGYVPETVKGKIYKGWVQIEGIPDGARLKRRGLDYGYSNDPTAIVDVYVWNNAFIWDEVMYRKGMSNKDIADTLKASEDILLVPDSAEPKSNDELISYGISLMPSQKGQGSVNQGIQYVQDQTIYITKRSKNIWKEYENYAWMVNKDGEMINTPKDLWNHAMDGGRYAMESLRPQEDKGYEDINAGLKIKWRL